MFVNYYKKMRNGINIDLTKEIACTKNIICMQPFACLPNHVTGKGMIKALREKYPKSNIVAVDYDPGASVVNQINRIKLMLSVAFKNLGDQVIELPKHKEADVREQEESKIINQ